jgi:hypothetical protein
MANMHCFQWCDVQQWSVLRALALEKCVFGFRTNAKVLHPMAQLSAHCFVRSDMYWLWVASCGFRVWGYYKLLQGGDGREFEWKDIKTCQVLGQVTSHNPNPHLLHIPKDGPKLAHMWPTCGPQGAHKWPTCGLWQDSHQRIAALTHGQHALLPVV